MIAVCNRDSTQQAAQLPVGCIHFKDFTDIADFKDLIPTL